MGMEGIIIMERITAMTSTGAEPGMAALPRLLQLVSPALPVGAYAYSEGLEYAVHAGWVRDEASARAWIEGRLVCGLGALELPVLLRLHAAWRAGEGDRVARWNDLLRAFRDSAELRDAERDMGQALARLLVALGVDEAGPWAARPETTHVAMFALAAARWDIAAGPAATGYGFAWIENQVAAAIKLVPLGQSAGQRIVQAASGQLAAVVARAADLDEDDVGATAPGLAIAASRHESMYTRLFRS
jgi:urease accessory protein